MLRYGYAFDSYDRLLTPIVFEITESEDVGGVALVYMQESIQKYARSVPSEFGAMLVSLASVNLIKRDPESPKEPFPIYVTAIKIWFSLSSCAIEP